MSPLLKVEDRGFDCEVVKELEKDQSIIDLLLQGGKMTKAEYLESLAPMLDTMPGIVDADFVEDVAVVRVHYYRAMVGPRDIVKAVGAAKVTCEVCEPATARLLYCVCCLRLRFFASH
jgi:hypothetical protein